MTMLGQDSAMGLLLTGNNYLQKWLLHGGNAGIFGMIKLFVHFLSFTFFALEAKNKMWTLSSHLMFA